MGISASKSLNKYYLWTLLTILYIITFAPILKFYPNPIQQKVTQKIHLWGDGVKNGEFWWRGAQINNVDKGGVPRAIFVIELRDGNPPFKRLGFNKSKSKKIIIS